MGRGGRYRQVISVVYGMSLSDKVDPAAFKRVPLKIWHSIAHDPETGNLWEPITDRWYTVDAMKGAFGFEPVVAMSSEESIKLAMKTKYVPSE
jgi:hypothetical protein